MVGWNEYIWSHLNVPHGLLPEVCAAEADLEEHDDGGDVLEVQLRVEQLLPQLRPPPRLTLGRAQQGQLGCDSIDTLNYGCKTGHKTQNWPRNWAKFWAKFSTWALQV